MVTSFQLKHYKFLSDLLTFQEVEKIYGTWFMEYN